MLYKQIIGADIGRDKGKFWISNHSNVKIPNEVGNWDELYLSEGGDSDYRVEFNGKKYFVGDLAKRESRIKRQKTTISKLHLETKIIFATGIGILCNDRLPVIGVGLPINQYTPKVRKDFSDLLCGTYRVSINEKPATEFTILKNQLFIIPEGGGCMWDIWLNQDGSMNDDAEYTEERIRIIDLGSKTTNIGVMDNQGWINSQSTTLEIGMLELTKNICKGKKPTPDQLEDWSNKIISECSNFWMDLEKDDIIIMAGGGSILLHDYFKSEFPNARIVDNPVWANAKGFMKMAVAKWENQVNQAKGN
jgi:plasmid segregation protein ParM